MNIFEYFIGGCAVIVAIFGVYSIIKMIQNFKEIDEAEKKRKERHEKLMSNIVGYWNTNGYLLLETNYIPTEYQREKTKEILGWDWIEKEKNGRS